MSNSRRRLRVDPQLVFGVSLIASLFISWPGLRNAMNGSADIMAVGVNLLVGVAVIWTGLFMVASLIASYSATASTVRKSVSVTNGPPVAERRATSNEIEADQFEASAIAANAEITAG